MSQFTYLVHAPLDHPEYGPIIAAEFGRIIGFVAIGVHLSAAEKADALLKAYEEVAKTSYGYLSSGPAGTNTVVAFTVVVQGSADHILADYGIHIPTAV